MPRKRIDVYRVVVDGEPRSKWVASRKVALKIANGLREGAKDRESPGAAVDGAIAIQQAKGIDHGRFGGGLEVLEGTEGVEKFVWETQTEQNEARAQAEKADRARKAHLDEESERAKARRSKAAIDRAEARVTASRAESELTPAQREREGTRSRSGRQVRRSPGGQALGRQERLERGAGASLARQRGMAAAGMGDLYDPAPGIANVDDKAYRQLSAQGVQWRSAGKFWSVNFNGRFRGNNMVHLIEVNDLGGIRINVDAISIDKELRRRFNMLLADEAVRSIKGMRSGIKGQGQYPFGIKHRRSPDGSSWAPLKESTLFFRTLKAGGAAEYPDYPFGVNRNEFIRNGKFYDPSTGHLRTIPTARGSSFALRETSRHIYNGLGLLSASEDHATVGWKGYHEDYGIPVSQIAFKQHTGFAMVFSAAEAYGALDEAVTVVVPPRPFIGLQPRYFKVAEKMAELLGRYWLLDNAGEKKTIRRGSVAFQMHASLAKFGRLKPPRGT